MEEKVNAIIEILKQRYPNALCALHYDKDYELMIAVRLSAQCTDARVNLVTPTLFAAYPTLEAMANADIAHVEELLKIPGVGRKTANLLLGDLYSVPGSVVCDTHCIRICGRLGLSHGKEPEKVEAQLRAVLPPEESSDFCHRIVLFGRDCCTARNPDCGNCPLSLYCREYNPEA